MPAGGMPARRDCAGYLAGLGGGCGIAAPTLVERPMISGRDGAASEADAPCRPPTMVPPVTVYIPKLRIGSRLEGQKCCARSVNHRSEEHTSELQSLMRTSYPVFCLKKKKKKTKRTII